MMQTTRTAAVLTTRTVAVLTTRTVAVIGGVWFAVAAAAAAAGLLQGLRPPAPQAILLSLSAMLLIAWRAIPPVRGWALALDARAIVALHIVRLFFGAYFLLLQSAGELPRDFATPAGIGDMIVGLLAIALVSFITPDERAARRWYLAWNILGFADILLVVATAARVGMRDPESMRALLRLPLSLLPTFLVPVIIASHVVLFLRAPIRPIDSDSPASHSAAQ